MLRAGGQALDASTHLSEHSSKPEKPCTHQRLWAGTGPGPAPSLGWSSSEHQLFSAMHRLESPVALCLYEEAKAGVSVFGGLFNIRRQKLEPPFCGLDQVYKLSPASPSSCVFGRCLLLAATSLPCLGPSLRFMRVSSEIALLLELSLTACSLLLLLLFPRQNLGHDKSWELRIVIRFFVGQVFM